MWLNFTNCNLVTNFNAVWTSPKWCQWAQLAPTRSTIVILRWCECAARRTSRKCGLSNPPTHQRHEFKFVHVGIATWEPNWVWKWSDCFNLGERFQQQGPQTPLRIWVLPRGAHKSETETRWAEPGSNAIRQKSLLSICSTKQIKSVAWVRPWRNSESEWPVSWGAWPSTWRTSKTLDEGHAESWTCEQLAVESERWTRIYWGERRLLQQ